MGYSHLLTPGAALASFRETLGVPEDVNIAYCNMGDIELERAANSSTSFFPLMSILEGGVRFPVDPLIIGTLGFCGLCPDQFSLNFYRVVSCVSRLNKMFGLQLNHHNINFMYKLCGNFSSGYYLKTRDMRVQLISCLPDSNKNSANEFVRVRGNWLASELLCQLSPRNVESKRFLPNSRVIHAQDLNFVLRLEIFVHDKGQLRASHLILGVNPVYNTWQNFSQALLVDSPLLSYIDVQYKKFLPPALTTRDARELGPRYTTADDIALVRDASAERVSQNRRRHEAIEQPENAAPIAEERAAEPAGTSGTKSDLRGEMVKRREMTFARFIPGARPVAPPQPPKRTLQAPLVDENRKRTRAAEKTALTPGGALLKTPPCARGGSRTLETLAATPPAAQVGMNVAFSSQPKVGWQPAFLLGDQPLPATASVWMWDKGEGGKVAQSLVKGLMLPEDVHYFSEGDGETLVRRLQWHTIAATQLTGVMDGRLKDAIEAVEREKALKAVAEVTAREKMEAVAASERKAIDAENKLTILETKLGEIELKLATADSLNLAQADQIADLKESLEACEEK
ncbi:uncharacterized protein LOC142640050 [Castanea sativa]|uniref:uncharacterized protein LOC142640050 n=1 Tax=Castanea sativa TaxID=21020 RepID=UPI003F6543AF